MNDLIDRPLRAPVAPVAPPPVSFSTELRGLVARFDDHPISIGDLVEALQGRGLRLLLILVTLPFATPIPLPGVSVPFGFVVLVLGIAFFLQHEPWLPEFLRRRQLPPHFLARVLGAAGSLVRLLETMLKPRLRAVIEHPARRSLSGLMIAISGLLLMQPIPFPLSNGLPACAVVLLAAGEIARDGLCFLAGCAAFACTVAFFSLLALGGVEAIEVIFRVFLPK